MSVAGGTSSTDTTRPCVVNSNGSLVAEINTTGDGIVATFDGPARAIQCACAIRDATAQLGLKVRAGVHFGEVELRGPDIAGMTAHIAARIHALADPGEVLVSRTVVDLVAGSTITSTDRDEHDLKGVPGTWQLFSARPRVTRKPTPIATTAAPGATIVPERAPHNPD